MASARAAADHSITYANLLDGLTIDLAKPAVPASDTDTFWVAQGSSTMLRQTFATIWSWLASKQPTYKLPVVEITVDTNLDGTIHNGRILICSQAVTLTPLPLNMGSGFYCDIINLSSGNVTLGSGIITSSGSNVLPSGQAASVRVATYSGGTVVFASLPTSTTGTGSAPAAPGQVPAISASNPTSSGVTLNWSPPDSGGAVSSYTVQYRVTGTTSWSTFATGVTATSSSVTGLVASTAYDFQVYAMNGGGAGPPSATASASTTAVARRRHLGHLEPGAGRPVYTRRRLDRGECPHQSRHGRRSIRLLALRNSVSLELDCGRLREYRSVGRICIYTRFGRHMVRLGRGDRWQQADSLSDAVHGDLT